MQNRTKIAIGGMLLCLSVCLSLPLPGRIILFDEHVLPLVISLKLQDLLFAGFRLTRNILSTRLRFVGPGTALIIKELSSVKPSASAISVTSFSPSCTQLVYLLKNKSHCWFTTPRIRVAVLVFVLKHKNHCSFSSPKIRVTVLVFVLKHKSHCSFCSPKMRVTVFVYLSRNKSHPVRFFPSKIRVTFLSVCVSLVLFLYIYFFLSS